MSYDPDEPRDAYGRWVSSGRDFLSRFNAKLKEDARIAAGRFQGNGGPGVKAKGVAASSAKKKEWAAESKFTSVKAILSMSGTDQAKLVALGQLISQKFGLKLSDPGPKSEKRLTEKVAAGKPASTITDATRMGWTVNSPAQADKIVAELAKHLQIADEGWSHTPAGYFDRKVLVRHPSGMLGEIQFWPPGMLHAKESGGAKSGHALYERMQDMTRKNPNDARLGSVVREMRTLYGSVLDKLPPSWNDAKGRG